MVSNPPKQKGTAGETELVRLLREAGLKAVRTPPTENYDIRVGMPGPDGGLDILATRPDRGQWLITLRLDDFIELVRSSQLWYDIPDIPVNVEVKRFKRFAHHGIFEDKFK